MFIQSFTTRRHCTSNYNVTASCSFVAQRCWNPWKFYYKNWILWLRVFFNKRWQNAAVNMWVYKIQHTFEAQELIVELFVIVVIINVCTIELLRWYTAATSPNVHSLFPYKLINPQAFGERVEWTLGRWPLCTTVS